MSNDATVRPARVRGHDRDRTGRQAQVTHVDTRRNWIVKVFLGPPGLSCNSVRLAVPCRRALRRMSPRLLNR